MFCDFLKILINFTQICTKNKQNALLLTKAGDITVLLTLTAWAYDSTTVSVI